MNAPNRDAVFKAGPRFFTDELTGETMFEFVVDGGTTVGPRPATDADIEAYADAAASMEAEAKAKVEAAKEAVKEAEKAASATSGAKGDVESRAKKIADEKKKNPAAAKPGPHTPPAPTAGAKPPEATAGPSKPIESDDHKKLREEQAKKK